MKFYKSMLAKKSENPMMNDERYLYEIKFDGARYFLISQSGRLLLQSRHFQNGTSLYPEITCYRPKTDFVADGELCYFDDNGIPNFKILQSREHLENPSKIKLMSKIRPCSFVFFDLLEVEGKSLESLPLAERKRILGELFLKEKFDYLPRVFLLSPTFSTNRIEEIVKQGYEGMMAKRKDSPYRQGVRSDDWLKLKFEKEEECIVIGYTKGEGSRERLGSLLIASKDLKYRGKVGSGLSEWEISELLKRMRPIPKPIIETDEKEATWVWGSVRVMVSYFEETERGHFRFPIFKKIIDGGSK